MTKYNGSTVSFADAVDKILETATSYCGDGYSIPFPPIEGYIFTWMWPNIVIDVPKIDIPSYPVSNGWLKGDGSLFIQIACTGFEKFELTVKAEDNILSVEAKKLSHAKDLETQTKEWKQLFHNLPTRDFEWKRRLSNKYDLEKLEARVINGILEITIPLKEACKPVKKEFEIK